MARKRNTQWEPAALPVEFDALDEGVALFNQTLDDVEKWDVSSDQDRQRAKAGRLYMGRVLAELRRRVEAGDAGEGVTWWAWYKKNLPNRTKRDAQKLLKIAGAPDPEAADAEAKAKNMMEAKKAREKKKDALRLTSAVVGSLTEAERQEAEFDPIKVALALVRNMDDAQRGEFRREFDALINPATPSIAPEAVADAPEPHTGSPDTQPRKRGRRAALA